MAAEEEAKLERFSQWLQVNGAQLRGCSIRYCGPSKGFGVFSSSAGPDNYGVLMVVPLDLAITPMRVLQDPLLGPFCGEMYNEGDVDDRFLMMLFLTVERLRPNSPWKPYIDMLPSSFNSPLWFTDDEFSELKGTSLYRATLLQKQSLQDIFDNKVKNLVMEILHSDSALEGPREVSFQDFLWANSVFWTRALNIPFSHSYVFPSLPVEGDACCLNKKDSGTHVPRVSDKAFGHANDERSEEAIPACNQEDCGVSTSVSSETVWAEGLVPGIDFCNHGLIASANWEVDNTGSKTGVPSSMYLLSADQGNQETEKEIFINYGNKGNEELLYLYGFVMNNNPDDYVMVHYPVDAFQTLQFADSKAELLKAQKAELRYLLPRSLLDRGFFSGETLLDADTENTNSGAYNYSWSGQRSAPSYLNKLVFPEELLTSFRTIAMGREELTKVSSLLEELVGPEGKRQPSDREVQAAIWEVCGDSGALQLLVDLLQAKMMELEESSGTENNDAELLQRFCTNADSVSTSVNQIGEGKTMSRNRWSSLVYRQGQKHLTRLFLKEAEHALDLCLREQG